ncbi:glyoxylate reductase [Yamadazyma tenuis]|uniref:Alpha-ketoisocaproate reductase n=1 Tax=Candida tenuis (strain ATCC 10573 / BCRC 21748 / CBS 615 / JCM 9827 / NBRC 10315 / NRRL Y-1498 / VKM Y-70) TaxID=590646 RepID=G3BD56_CANTC|nr:alpha-ketoisocaproate reductase [Yamadazyma tenuis ATCC 10573]XP_006690283.1 uncharacterized protein CANTEDRAFT_116306 [Yamadazyma tenuis ATCC 10573]EGV61068.1 alpha-ketoisocaproate reductase [Yamadazyma tenuis ATCC 10573]EGV61069.1 hypothetical protein CANTEDRAFT_116306 [Yamadazyma tenuis ATCC 10573]WEJ94513.1 glyoxylate reductase [Yamadazyma tenuis]
MSTKPKVLWIGAPFASGAGWDELSHIADVQACTSKDRQEFIQDLKGKYNDITCIGRTFNMAQTGRFDEELVSHFPPTLKAVCNSGAGYDQVDVEPLIKRNIQLSNVTTPVEAPTADTAVYLVLATLRNFQEGHDLMVKGKWVPGVKSAGSKLGHNPSAKVVGILGMGGIGRAIRDRLVPFGFKKIIYYNRSKLSPDLEQGAEYTSFDDLISNSDIICVSVPLNPKTHHLLDAKVLGKMKKDVIIVNTARGAVIDEAAILDKLQNNEIGFFGSDVFEFEPKVSQDLLNLPNVVSLPHMGTHTVEAVLGLESFTVENIDSVLRSGKVKTVVPEMAKIDFGHQPLV